MSIDGNSRFAKNPVNLDIQRSTFRRPHTHKTTFTSGKLIPIYLDEVLPGDTHKLDFSSVVRMFTPAVPVMDNAFIDYYFFWVPNRIATLNPNDWKEIIANENLASAWAPAETKTLLNTGNAFYLSTRTFAGDGENIPHVPYVRSGSAMSYLGIPTGTYTGNVSGIVTNCPINLMPLKAYCLIYNEWFRDQNTQSPINLDNSDFLLSNNLHTTCLNVNKLHDMFTSALPSPQKGQASELPIASSAPVYSTSMKHAVYSSNNSFKAEAGSTSYVSTYTDGPNLTGVRPLVSDANNGNVVRLSSSTMAAGAGGVYFDNLYADLSAAVNINVNQLREAFAVQRMLEKDARGGTRYREMLKAHFGVTVPDSTVQIPEYLAGKRVPVNVTQVLQTTPTAEQPIGSTGAFSNTAYNSHMFTKSFSEHGYIIGVACVRAAQTYSQGLSKTWLRNSRFDWYFPTFANLGEQPIRSIELYINNGTSNNPVVTSAGVSPVSDGDSSRIFGFQEAWAEYRYFPNRVSGGFVPVGGELLLQSWTYTNYFSARPVLNSQFMLQDQEQIGHTLVSDDTSFQFIADFYFDVRSTRPMPIFSIPGLIDHH